MPFSIFPCVLAPSQCCLKSLRNQGVICLVLTIESLNFFDDIQGLINIAPSFHKHFQYFLDP